MTHPPAGPSTPPPPSGPKKADAAQLAEIDDLLVAALARATLLPESADRVEESGQVILAFRLELARRAVADLVRYTQSPARQHLDFAAAVVDGPVEPRAGEPPLPGAAKPFELPTPPFVLGVGVPYDALPPVDTRPYRERIKP